MNCILLMSMESMFLHTSSAVCFFNLQHHSFSCFVCLLLQFQNIFGINFSVMCMFSSSLLLIVSFKQLEDTEGEEKTDTDKNMSTMFNILREKKKAQLEHLILNRFSFAQTVENLFALSFLVKDGRAEINMDDKLSHYVCKTCCFCHNYPTICFHFFLHCLYLN